MSRHETPVTLMQLVRSNADVIAALPERGLTAMDLARYLAEQDGCPFTVDQLSRAIWRHRGSLTRALPDDRRATLAQLFADAAPTVPAGAAALPAVGPEQRDRELAPDSHTAHDAGSNGAGADAAPQPPTPAPPDEPNPVALALREPAGPGRAHLAGTTGPPAGLTRRSTTANRRLD